MEAKMMVKVEVVAVNGHEGGGGGEGVDIGGRCRRRQSWWCRVQNSAASCCNLTEFTIEPHAV